MLTHGSPLVPAPAAPLSRLFPLGAARSLFAQVLAGRRHAVLVSPGGQRRVAPGLGARADAVAAASARYLLDEPASRFCIEAMLTGTGQVDGLPLRLPAERFWIEWVVPAECDASAGHVRGALIEAEPGGRAGRLTAYWSDASGQPGSFPVVIDFDLDGIPSPRDGLRLRHGELAAVDALLTHCAMRIDSVWADHIRRIGVGRDEWIATLARLLWPYVPTVFAFAQTLGRRLSLTHRAAGIDSHGFSRVGLRPERIADGRIDLAANDDRARGPRPVPSRPRCAARMHHVRGHLVRRAGKTFWRRPHVRGETQALWCRTTKVTARDRPSTREESE